MAHGGKSVFIIKLILITIMIGVTVNQPLVVAQKQKIIITRVILEHEEEYVEVYYKVEDENGVVVKSGNERFANPLKGEEFYSEYATKNTPYEKLFERLGLNESIPEIPDTLTNNPIDK